MKDGDEVTIQERPRVPGQRGLGKGWETVRCRVDGDPRPAAVDFLPGLFTSLLRLNGSRKGWRLNIRADTFVDGQKV